MKTLQPLALGVGLVTVGALGVSSFGWTRVGGSTVAPVTPRPGM